VKLFDILPGSLFSILVSKNKSLYVEALFVIRKAFKQEMTIRKDDLVSMLISNLDEAILELDLEAELDEFQDDETVKSGQSLSAIAHHLIRRLVETKWIEVEYQMDSFEENITLPDYSVKLLNLLYSFTDETVREYNSYVYSTYSALRTADAERDDFMFNALSTAYENTLKLVDELKTLHNNIRRYHQTLNEYATANDILKGHFDQYKELIVDRIYHPLKTLDSVPRFKIPILKILADWLSDLSVRQKMASQAVQRGKYSTVDEAMENIIIMMGEMSDIFEGIDAMLEEIDRKNTAYTRASIEKMQYLLNTDRSIKGKLVDILSSGEIQNDKLIDRMSESINIFRQGFVDEKSLFTKRSTSTKKEGNPLPLRETAMEVGDKGLESFVKKMGSIYNHQRVMAYVNRLMAGGNIINSSDIRLESDEDFILLILAAVKNAERGLPYRVEFGCDTLDCCGYKIPDMRFVRKGNV
jgi:hypothetical protein